MRPFSQQPRNRLDISMPFQFPRKCGVQSWLFYVEFRFDQVWVKFIAWAPLIACIPLWFLKVVKMAKIMPWWCLVERQLQDIWSGTSDIISLQKLFFPSENANCPRANNFLRFHSIISCHWKSCRSCPSILNLLYRYLKVKLFYAFFAKGKNYLEEWWQGWNPTQFGSIFVNVFAWSKRCGKNFNSKKKNQTQVC